MLLNPLLIGLSNLQNYTKMFSLKFIYCLYFKTIYVCKSLKDLKQESAKSMLLKNCHNMSSSSGTFSARIKFGLSPSEGYAEV